jgi:hypothetical protein
MLWLQTIKEGSGKMNLGGSLTRQAEIDSAVSDNSPHIANIGRMVEVGGERRREEEGRRGGREGGGGKEDEKEN